MQNWLNVCNTPISLPIKMSKGARQPGRQYFGSQGFHARMPVHFRIWISVRRASVAITRREQEHLLCYYQGKKMQLIVDEGMQDYIYCSAPGRSVILRVSQMESYELDRYVGHFLHDTKQRTMMSDYCPSLLLGFPGFYYTLSQAWSHIRMYTSPHGAYFCIQPFLAQHGEMTMECTMPASNINPIESKFGSQLSMIFSKAMRIPSAYAWAMLLLHCLYAYSVVDLVDYRLIFGSQYAYKKLG